MCLVENAQHEKIRANKGSCELIVLFIAIVLFLRIYSFPRNLSSRSSKNSLSVSKLVTRSLKLDSRSSKIETRNSSLETRFSKTLRIENRVSSHDCQLTFERYCSSEKLAKKGFPIFLTLLQRLLTCL